MQVVLKPAGILFVLLVIGVALWVLLVPHGGTPTAEPTATSTPPPPLLQNASLEEPFQNARPFGSPTSIKATVQGEIANGWRDNSDWADLTVRYGIERTNVIEGKACQKIETKNIGSGQVQLVQEVRVVPGKNYTLSAKARASGTATIELLFRDFETENSYSTKKVPVTTDWRTISVTFSPTGKAGTPRGGFLMVAMPTKNTTYWVDDVRMFEDAP
jgi:hypothetical protein